MEIQTRTDRGQVRPVNEDAILTFSLEGYEVVLLADGLGGHKAGEVASRMVVESMQEYILQHGLQNVERTLLDAGMHANKKVYQRQKEEPEQAGMGSTVVASAMDDQSAHIAHAGDSRAYLFTGNEFIQLTRDHSVSNDFQASSGEMNENLKHMLTRAMGTEPHIAIDYQTVHFTQDSILLLCSDGLSNEVSAEEMEEILRSDVSLKEKADLLLLRANERGGKDNITLALCEQKGVAA